MDTHMWREVRARIEGRIDATWAFSALAASEIRCSLRDPDGHLIEVGQTTGTPSVSEQKTSSLCGIMNSCAGRWSEEDHMWSRHTTLSPSDEPAPGNTAEAPRVASRQQRRRRPVLAIVTRLFNPLTRHLAGSRYFPLVALVRHRGRRSGRLYATPTMARPTVEGFVVPLTFGEGADWYRNVQAAGGGAIRWRGTDYVLVAPEVVDWATVRSAFSPGERFLLPRFGIAQYVRLQHAHSQA